VPLRLSRGVAALIGVISVAAALAAGHLVGGFAGPNSSPIVAVGNSAIDLTPPALKDFAVRTFGTYDKVVLLGGMALVMVLLAAFAGLLSRRNSLPGLIVFGVFGAIGVLAVYSRPDLGQIAIFAPMASLLAGVGVFSWLHRRAMDSVRLAAADDPSGRRDFLKVSAGVVIGAGVAGLAGQLIGTSKDATSSRVAVGTLTPALPAAPVPPGADFAKLGTPSFVTSNRDFYRVDTAIVVPQVRTEDWSLRIHGMVDNEIKFGYSDIRNRPLVERIVTMTCVSNEVGGQYISTAKFVGVNLHELLDEAGVNPGAQQLYSSSVDGWTCGTPVSVVTDPARGAMLAIGMNDEPLPVEHGFPARMVVPGLYGYVSGTKWVTDMELTTWDGRRSYWLERGWGEQGPIKTESRIDVPKGFTRVPSGRMTVAGIAWAQHTGIEKVEVRLDNGPWQPAQLSTVVNEDTWRMWYAQLDVPRGSHNVSARATDKSGYTQTGDRVDVIPDGATGWHTVLFDAV
jgi:DMSO/TMAO reductase YedYZ molybdopterin-dependent catalytic subunit